MPHTRLREMVRGEREPGGGRRRVVVGRDGPADQVGGAPTDEWPAPLEGDEPEERTPVLHDEEARLPAAGGEVRRVQSWTMVEAVEQNDRWTVADLAKAITVLVPPAPVKGPNID